MSIDISREDQLKDDSPVFIVGNGRCGSTLLRLMLNAHPRLAIMGEIHYFDRIVRLREHVPDLATVENRDRFFALLPEVEGMDYLADFESQLATVRELLDADPQPTFEQFYRLLMRSYACSEGAPRHGDKSLEHVRHLNSVVQLFPEARIIHLVRDPRAVVESMLRMPWAPDDVIASTSKWRANVWAAAHFADTDQRILESRYEDLVLEPERELRRICAFLGEEYDAQMLNYHESASAYVRNEPWKEGSTSPVHRASVELWRERLPAWRIALIEMIAGRLMRRYGYERSPIGWPTRLSAPLRVFGELSRYRAYSRRDSAERNRRYKIQVGDSAGDLLRLLL